MVNVFFWTINLISQIPNLISEECHIIETIMTYLYLLNNFTFKDGQEQLCTMMELFCSKASTDIYMKSLPGTAVKKMSLLNKMVPEEQTMFKVCNKNRKLYVIST